jgi:hypothetical protein
LEYTKTDPNERDSEHENTSETGITDSPHLSNASNPTLKNISNNVPYSDSIKPYEHLIETKYLPNLDRIAYCCKEHPNAPEYYDLKGIQESHFKPFHKKVG